MDGIDLNKISDELFDLIIQFHKKTFHQEDIIKCSPIPPSHFKVIFFLAHHGSSSVSRIGQNLNISKPNMTPIIDSLVQNDYVRRFEDPKDRRKIRIELTNKAYELLHEKKKRMTSKLCDQISALSDEDIRILDESIKNLSNIIPKL
ncbi:MarR family winged helix-turn-helix transcriptional regulator [Clostridium cylindrosporum]|uniref:MarR family protein n=1 Tax=Clostridium cylindrosporum DSM 605 TaxID=1121307 RepID=A0A0J8G3H5_CLOCY|nr:MarR family transcriptional regulator [Clostridium cylindrosporum]KMT22266.1 MarR family protein [Clostridium cylindrosporum DSM 605]